VAAAGSFVTIPPRALHAFRVLGAPARFLHVSVGSGATDAFRDYHQTVPHTPDLADLPALLEINARHGVEVVLPADLAEAVA
jgi:hypothetical protein